MRQVGFRVKNDVTWLDDARRLRGFLSHRARGRQKPEFCAGAQCASSIDGRGHVVLPPVVISSVASIFLPRRRLTHLIRKPRVPRWSLLICVRSRAPGQNSSSHRSLRPHWQSNSLSFVDVQDETVKAPVVRQVCTATFLKQMPTPPANGRVDAQQGTVVYGAWISRRVPCRESTSHSVSQPSLNRLTNWLSFSCESESRGWSMMSKVSLRAILSRRVVYLIPPSVSDSPPVTFLHCSLSLLRVRHCAHLVVWKMTSRTSCLHVLTTSSRPPDSDRPKTNLFFS